MTPVPKNTEVIDLSKVLNSGKKYDQPLIPNVGWYKLPLFKKDNLVIFHIIYYRDEAIGLAILAKDEYGNIRDFIFDPVSGVFQYFTIFKEHPIDWKERGFNETPSFVRQLSKDFNLSGYSDTISFTDEIKGMIENIAEKESSVAKALEMVIRHIHGTYSDKYAKGQDVIDTKKMLYDKERGDFLNIYQVNRYLQRYLTQGSAKSHLIKDIEKAIHYLIFELTRRIMMGDVDEIEPKV